MDSADLLRFLDVEKQFCGVLFPFLTARRTLSQRDTASALDEVNASEFFCEFSSQKRVVIRVYRGVSVECAS